MLSSRSEGYPNELLIVVGVFILCWGAFFINTLLSGWYNHPNLYDINSRSLLSYTGVGTEETAELVIVTLPYFNSLCNPVIYAFLDQTYREVFKSLFRRMMCRTSTRIRRPPNEIDLTSSANKIKQRYSAQLCLKDLLSLFTLQDILTKLALAHCLDTKNYKKQKLLVAIFVSMTTR